MARLLGVDARAGAGSRRHLPDGLPRRPLAALLCSTLLWWVPGSPALGPVAAGAEPTEDPGESPIPVSVAVAAASTADAPVVVRSGVTATLGRADTAFPDRTLGPTVVGDVVLDAYALAAAVAPASCHLETSLLAAIGQVESGNLSGHRLDADHRPVPAVLGPVLDGSDGFAAVSDTDRGQWDGNTKWDRAVGPMQFIPSSWRLAGVDLDADGERNPQDIEDAAGAAMVYLCAGGADLSTDAALQSAIFAYNHSSSYVRLVLAWKNAFDTQGLDLAEPPQLELTAVEYERLVTSLDESTARTVKARGLTDVGPGQGAAGQAIGETGEQVQAGHKPRPTPYLVPAPVSASASGAPSASASGSASGSASAPASASGSASAPTSASAPASASAPEGSASPGTASSSAEPAAESSSAGAAASDAPAKAEEPASQAPAAQDPAPDPGPQSPPADEPPPAPAEEPTPPAEPACTTPSPSPADAPAADPGAPTGEAATPPGDPATDPGACGSAAAEPSPPPDPPAATVTDTPAAAATP